VIDFMERVTGIEPVAPTLAMYASPANPLTLLDAKSRCCQNVPGTDGIYPDIIRTS
jgi:hypothetical protein